MQIALKGGAYQTRSLIASAQRCVNLYPEANPEGAPYPFTYYPTPGLRELASLGFGTVRGVYRCSNGLLIVVKGTNVYTISASWVPTLLGTIDGNTTPVSLSDNGTIAVIVDGSAEGYYIPLASPTLNPISDDTFYGANVVDQLDGYFIFNRPLTNQFYWSPPFWDGVAPFDPLDIAAKSGSPDPIVTIQVCRRELWLFGALTTEVWQLTGAADSLFERTPGVFVEQGCGATFSIASQDLQQFWLHQDLQGKGMILSLSSDYSAKRISTHAIENEIMSYPVISDAVAFTYQQEGHTFYQISFPTADKTWVYDVATSEWHERAWMDPDDGTLHRHRANFGAFAYGTNVVGDWENGHLYAYDLDVYTDHGRPIRHIRGFPHMVDDAVRITYRRFVAAMQVGDGSNNSLTETVSETYILGCNYTMEPVDDFCLGVDDETVLGIGTESGPVPVSPMIELRWSDTAGYSWSTPRLLPLGRVGQYLTSVQETRLGMARDRVFEIAWAAPVRTAVSGAWVDIVKAAT